jgi:toxin-antitoxin system PIN domain toxin
VIAVDSNLLVYAHRQDSPWHDRARECIRALAEGPATWAIPWPCIHEFMNIVTHPRIYRPPSTAGQALEQVEAWTESPTLVLLSEAHGYWGVLRPLVERGRIVGARIHDARIAAICALHGVRELWTADRDFSAIPAVTVRNPLVQT